MGDIKFVGKIHPGRLQYLYYRGANQVCICYTNFRILVELLCEGRAELRVGVAVLSIRFEVLRYKARLLG